MIKMFVYLLCLLPAVLIRYVFVKKPLEPIKATYIGFFIAFLVSTACILMFGGLEGNMTLGFVVLFGSYTILKLN